MFSKRFEKKAFKAAVKDNVKTLYRKTIDEATPQQLFQAVSYAVKDVIIDDWIETQKRYDETDAKTVYYMSMEFLMGRALGNNLINMIERLEEAFQDMGTGLGLAQFELGTPDHHFAAMVEEIGQRGLEVQQHGAVVHHGQHVDAERGFQRRVLVQRVDDDLGHGAALQLHAHAFPHLFLPV